jgi:hypothetical protein
MPHKTELVEVIENLENQIMACIISNILNDLNTTFDNTNITTTIESDDEVLNNFVLYKFMQ